MAAVGGQPDKQQDGGQRATQLDHKHDWVFHHETGIQFHERIQLDARRMIFESNRERVLDCVDIRFRSGT